MNVRVGYKKTKDNNKLIWTIACVIALLGFIFSFLMLSEYYTIAIAKKTEAYPWGAINENPWYYKTSAIYANYSLISGLLFSGASFLLLWGLLRQNKKLGIIGICLILIFILADTISANIQN